MKKRLNIINFILLGILFIFAILNTNFTNATISIISPANYTNHTGTAVFNVSYANGTDFDDAINASFYYNLSGTWTIIGSTTDCNNGATFGSCNGTLDISTLIEGIYGIKAIIANTSSNYTSSTALTHHVILDTTPPNVSKTSSPSNYGNYSGTFNINVSVTDGGISVESVFFNITFSNGTWVDGNYSKASASGGYYNLTIFGATFQEGRYNISIHANDSLNNLNNTEWIQIIIDNTNPTGNIGCSPTSVNTGDTVSCSCSGSDATSGVANISYIANPSTAQTGTLTVACTVTDYAGNSVTVSTSYIVESVAPTSRITTPTFKYSKTIPQTGQDFSEIGSIQTSSFSGGGLGARERVRFKLNNEEHYVGVKSLTSGSATIEIASNPVELDLSVGEETKRDFDGDGYYDVYVKLNGISDNKADLTITYLHEQISTPQQEEQKEEVVSTPVGEIKKSSLTWFWIVLGAVVVGVAVVIFLKKNSIKRKIINPAKKRK